jgi:hypothetical protein
MTYEYDRRWSANPHNSLGFGIKEGHVNPGIHTEKGVYRPDELEIGRYAVPAKNLVMPYGQDLELSDDMLDLIDDNLQETRGRRVGDFVYLGDSNPNSPEVGDVRIRYVVVPGDREMTFFGALSEGRLVPFGGTDRGAFRMEVGGLDQSVHEANRKFTRDKWIVRLVSFAMVFVGMLLMVSLPLLRRRSLFSCFAVLVLASAWSAGAVVAYGMIGGVHSAAAVTLLAWFSAFMIGRGQMKKFSE